MMGQLLLDVGGEEDDGPTSSWRAKTKGWEVWT
jgi:hypothetical protein